MPENWDFFDLLWSGIAAVFVGFAIATAAKNRPDTTEENWPNSTGKNWPLFGVFAFLAIVFAVIEVITTDITIDLVPDLNLDQYLTKENFKTFMNWGGGFAVGALLLGYGGFRLLGQPQNNRWSFIGDVFLGAGILAYASAYAFGLQLVQDDIIKWVAVGAFFAFFAFRVMEMANDGNRETQWTWLKRLAFWGFVATAIAIAAIYIPGQVKSYLDRVTTPAPVVIIEGQQPVACAAFNVTDYPLNQRVEALAEYGRTCR